MSNFLICLGVIVGVGAGCALVCYRVTAGLLFKDEK